MMELRDLYQEVILDHNRSPRNSRRMENPTGESHGYNPLCGDKLTLYIKIYANIITDISFVGCGCAISIASASLMTEALLGKEVRDASCLFDNIHDVLTGKNPHPDLKNLGKLSVLVGVKAYPSRVKCATLAWHTLRAVLNKKDETVSTE